MPTAHKSADSSSISLLDKRRDTSLLKKKFKGEPKYKPASPKKGSTNLLVLRPQNVAIRSSCRL
jgi:hypothetical protein